MFIQGTPASSVRAKVSKSLSTAPLPGKSNSLDMVTGLKAVMIVFAPSKSSVRITKTNVFFTVDYYLMLTIFIIIN